MLDWLFGKKKSKELPEYSALTSRPSRELPAEFVEQEGSEAFSSRRESIQQELLEGPRRPPDDAPLLTAFLNDQGSGVVTMTLPEGAGQCLPVFTTPIRAADYRQNLLVHGPATRYLSSAPGQFVKMLRDIEKMGIETLTVDRCPRCSVLTTFGSSSIKTAADVVTIWAIHKATELARTQVYFAYALQMARADRFDVARDVGLETASHVTVEDPRLHVLLGQIAIGLGDRALLQEAKAFLALLNQDRWERKLDQAAKSGSPDFEGLE